MQTYFTWSYLQIFVLHHVVQKLAFCIYAILKKVEKKYKWITVQMILLKS